MATNFVPLIAPVNTPTYDSIQFYNSALALFAGTGFASFSFLLVPPLSPAVTTRRLLRLTLRDLRRIAGGPVPQKCDDWGRRVYARLVSLPDTSQPLDRAQLFAALSAGIEIIRLHRIVRRIDLAPALEPALKALAQGHSTLARDELARLDRILATIPMQKRAFRLALRARGNLLALSEVLAQHALYFDAGSSK